MTEAQILDEIIKKILTGGRRTTGANLRGVLNSIASGYLNREDGGNVLQAIIGYASSQTFNNDNQIPNKLYVDTAISEAINDIDFSPYALLAGDNQFTEDNEFTKAIIATGGLDVFSGALNIGTTNASAINIGRAGSGNLNIRGSSVNIEAVLLSIFGGTASFALSGTSATIGATTINLSGNVNINGTVNLPNLTASQRLELDASKNIISVAKGTADNKDFGITAGTVMEGNDSRVVTEYLTEFDGVLKFDQNKIYTIAETPVSLVNIVLDVENSASDKIIEIWCPGIGYSIPTTSNWVNLSNRSQDTNFLNKLVFVYNKLLNRIEYSITYFDLVVSGSPTLVSAEAAIDGTLTLTYNKEINAENFTLSNFSIIGDSTAVFTPDTLLVHVQSIIITTTPPIDENVTIAYTKTTPPFIRDIDLNEAIAFSEPAEIQDINSLPSFMRLEAKNFAVGALPATIQGVEGENYAITSLSVVEDALDSNKKVFDIVAATSLVNLTDTALYAKLKATFTFFWRIKISSIAASNWIAYPADTGSTDRYAIQSTSGNFKCFLTESGGTNTKMYETPSDLLITDNSLYYNVFMELDTALQEVRVYNGLTQKTVSTASIAGDVWAKIIDGTITFNNFYIFGRSVSGTNSSSSLKAHSFMAFEGLLSDTQKQIVIDYANS